MGVSAAVHLSRHARSGGNLAVLEDIHSCGLCGSVFIEVLESRARLVAVPSLWIAGSSALRARLHQRVVGRACVMPRQPQEFLCVVGRSVGGVFRAVLHEVSPYKDNCISNSHVNKIETDPRQTFKQTSNRPPVLDHCCAIFRSVGIQHTTVALVLP